MRAGRAKAAKQVSKPLPAIAIESASRKTTLLRIAVLWVLVLGLLLSVGIEASTMHYFQ